MSSESPSKEGELAFLRQRLNGWLAQAEVGDDFRQPALDPVEPGEGNLPWVEPRRGVLDARTPKRPLSSGASG